MSEVNWDPVDKQFWPMSKLMEGWRSGATVEKSSLGGFLKQ